MTAEPTPAPMSAEHLANIRRRATTTFSGTGIGEDYSTLLATLDAKDEEIARLTERAEAAEIERDEIASAHEALTLEMEAMEGGEQPAPKESTR